MKLFLVAACLGVAFNTAVRSQVLPYQNPKLEAKERAQDLLECLTLDEKVALMVHTSPAVERLGIRPYNWWSEALHGVARNGTATVFPITMGMASSFDIGEVERVYSAVSDEARAKYNEAHRNGRYGYETQGLTFWTPNVNIFRDPRWGRGQETWGEDPYLASRMGVAVVRGLQGPSDAKYDKLHACAKHYAVHSGPESKRHYFNVENLDSRDLWETYLPAFKTLVQEADVKEVMCAYQRFEGEPCCGSNRLLTQILRNEWGFKYVVVSDCGAIGDFFNPGLHGTHPDAVSASSSAVSNGTDLECGWGDFKQLTEGVKRGLITEERINESLLRLLEARFALGEMDADSLVSWNHIGLDTIDCPTHKQLALDMARKSLVLLHNNGVLPLDKAAGNVAVMGPNATDSVMQWGNYEGRPSRTVTILDGIRVKVPGVTYERGCGLLENEVFESYFNQVTHDGRPGMKGSYWNNIEMKGDVAVEQELPTPINLNNGGNTAYAAGVALQNFSAVYEGVFRPTRSGRYDMEVEGDDGFRVYVNGKAVIDAWGHHPAEKRAYALEAEAGKEYAIRLEYMQGGGEAMLRFDVGVRRLIRPTEVVARVADAETVIFVGGISPELEGEEKNNVHCPGFAGGDRTSIELPLVQRDILRALKAAGKKVVFVNCSGAAMALVPEIESCDAILQAWYPGQAGGTAVADVLFGDFNPCGKLPVTFYRNTDQLPDFEDYSMKGRTYRYMTEKPLFPFGYGLSYTSFSITKGKLNRFSVKAGMGVKFTALVENTGNREGAEVLQLYVRKVGDTDGPVKTLRAFRCVELKAGESRKVTVELGPDAFEFFDTKTNTMRVVPGEYEIHYGNSSDTPAGNVLKVTLK